MLKLKHTHHLHLPHLSLPTRPMQFSPISADADELTHAVESYATEHDDSWELNERPDAGELNQFWETVVEDVSHDPEWFKFSND